MEGMVDDIGRNITGTPYVSLSGDMMPQDISVNCYFAKDNESQVIGISKLTRVTIKGFCNGLKMTRIVEITDCELVPRSGSQPKE